MLQHLAGIECYQCGESVQLKPSRYPRHGGELADGFEAVFAYANRLHSESMEIFRRLKD
jgi:hypothetical protein